MLNMQRNHFFHFSRFLIVFVTILVCTPLRAQIPIEMDEDIRKEPEQIFRSIGGFAGKVFRVTKTVFQEIGAEMREFKKDIEECCPEFNEVKDSLKVQTKRGLELCRREMHRGFRQGLRGESYDSTRD